jgi:subtilisin family serine protease
MANQKTIKVRIGSEMVSLRKNGTMVGLKMQATRGLEESQVKKETKPVENPFLSGFEVVKVKKKRGEKLNDKLDELRQSDEVKTGSHIFNTKKGNSPIVPTGIIFINFADSVTETKQIAILEKFSLNLKQRRNPLYLVAEVTPQSPNPFKCAAALEALKEVVRAQADIDMPVCHYFSEPTAQLYGHMWHLQNKGQVPDNPSQNSRLKAGADTKTIEAWKLLGGYGNPNIVVAVNDMGFDIEHPDLSDKIVKPFDIYAQTTDLASQFSEYEARQYNHGTACASLAIAPQNGITCGSAPAARFMPVHGTSISAWGLEEMLDYCMKAGADIISCSWGRTYINDSQDEGKFTLSPEHIAVLTKVTTEGRGGKGCVVCFAAGNESSNEFINAYGEHPNVICVASSSSQDEHADYSNSSDSGITIAVSAGFNGGNAFPNTAARASWDNEHSSDPAQFYYGDSVDRGPKAMHFEGTSAATPILAGICALILSANPNLRAAEVKQILINTADKIGGPSEYNSQGYSRRLGHGRVNAFEAVKEALRRAGKNPDALSTAHTDGFSDNSGQPFK